jgi:GT2 family glycosyltransferase
LREVIRRDVQMQIVEATGEFSFSDRVNLGVANSDRPVVVLLNDDMEVLSPNWLDRLSSAAATPGVGAAGATLLYADGTIQHGGLTTTENLPTHAYYGWAPEDPVDGGRLVKDRVAWALTGACMAVSRPHWDLVGGFSELFPVNYNDVDFCLKLTQEGLVNVILGAVHLHHFETRTRPRLLGAPEVAAIQDRWLHRLGHDPLLVGTSALVDRRDPDLG